MAKKTNKYYVVWKGHKPGIYDSWKACQQQTAGYPGAIFKGFKTRAQAEQAFAGDSADYIGVDVFESTLSQEQLAAIGKPILDSVSVDAACDGTPGRLEYRGVDTRTGEVLFEQGPFEDGTNNIGEFLAIVHAAAILKKRNSSKPIYTDSRTAIIWVRNKKARTRLLRTSRNKPLFELIARAEKWLAENEIENDILKWETQAWGEIAADYGRK